MTAAHPDQTTAPESVEPQLVYVGLTVSVVIGVVGQLESTWWWIRSPVGPEEMQIGLAIAAGNLAAYGLLLGLRGVLVRALYGAPGRGVRGAAPVGLLHTIALGLLGGWLLLTSLPSWLERDVGGGTVAQSVCGAALVWWTAARSRGAAATRPRVMIGAHQLARAMLVLWGLALLPGTLVELFITWYSGRPAWGGGHTAALTVVLAWSGLLLVKRNAVVRVVMGDLGALPSPLPAPATLWGAGISVIGLWVLMTALPGLLQPFVTDHLPAYLDPDPAPIEPGFRLRPWFAVLLAVFLVFEGHRLGAVWAGRRGGEP